MKLLPLKNQYDISFQAGLKPEFMKEIKNLNPNAAVNNFKLYNIESEFSDNKIIAWCCSKVLDILKEINKQNNTNLGFPKAIFVEDFKNLKIDTDNIIGFSTFQPSRINKRDTRIYPEQTIFFNKNFNWDLIDFYADTEFLNKNLPTNHFLDVFVHEFGHAAHSSNILKKCGVKRYLKFLDNIKDRSLIEEYNETFSEQLSSLCIYAKRNPLETIACHFSKSVLEIVNKNNLSVNTDFKICHPYDSKYKIMNIINSLKKNTEKEKFFKFLTDVWNGKIIEPKKLRRD